MAVSSNSLFHFTNKYEYLVNILQNGFRVRYCKEYGWGKNHIDFALPMVCFCDIPLSQIKEHTSFYGEFGIGISRQWISKNKNINPVQYVNHKSTEYSHILKILTKLKNKKCDEIELRKLILAKKISGKVSNKVGKIQFKKFYDEREWRYVPDNIESFLLPISKDDQFNSVEKSKAIKECYLPIPPESIRYIIIPYEQSRSKIINTIEKIYSNYDKSILAVLFSRIISLEQIKDDF